MGRRNNEFQRGVAGDRGAVRKCAKDKHESKKAEKLLWHAKKKQVKQLYSAPQRCQIGQLNRV